MSSSTLTRPRPAPAEAPVFAEQPTLGRRSVFQDGLTGRRLVGGARAAARAAVALLAFLGLWELAPRLGWADPVFLPPFS